ncbi:MAG: SynChlorMet cassette protein ScmC [Anaerolinea sp.]|nr:SynChlorMet cassette protein ScmC [Anaerolinea sp.]
MTQTLQHGLQHNLVLADRNCFQIAAGDEGAASILSQLGRSMRLRMTTGLIEPPHHGNLCQLLVRVDARRSVADRYVPSASENDGIAVCVLGPCNHSDGLYIQLMQLSSVIARETQARGGVLIHGALAERDGMGVILAAPGGTGKTTASNRLPAPWRSLCDDTTLVVRDLQGNYWAHPWPTWSRFLWGGSGDTWDVQRAVPLKGIFFLTREVVDRVESIGPGHAVSLLVECAKQASQFMARGLSKEETRALNLEQFNNLCDLARVVPAHVLHISLTGAFWQEIEQALNISDSKPQVFSDSV